MIQIPNPGDGWTAAGGVRYVLTFEELCVTGYTTDEAIEQWLLARRGRFEVRALGAEEKPRERMHAAESTAEYRARAWAVTMITPWHVYTITTPPGVGFRKGIEEGCKTIDRTMLERGQAVDMSRGPGNSLV